MPSAAGMAEKAEADGKAEDETFDKFQCHSKPPGWDAVGCGTADVSRHSASCHTFFRAAAIERAAQAKRNFVERIIGESQACSLNCKRSERSCFLQRLMKSAFPLGVFLCSDNIFHGLQHWEKDAAESQEGHL